LTSKHQSSVAAILKHGQTVAGGPKHSDKKSVEVEVFAMVGPAALRLDPVGVAGESLASSHRVP
jgi:hypothetical protein